MTIIVSRDGKNAKRVEPTSIEQEKYLQQYIHDNPDVLPLDDLKNGLRLLVLAREFPTGSGQIDALAVDGDGDVYIIETKLYKNADKRLVIAQALDYGASLWKTYSNPAEFLTRLDQYVTRGLKKPTMKALEDFFGIDESLSSELLDSVKGNLVSGSFRFIILMDSMDERLKDLISFVNTNSNFDVIGVELDYYQHDGYEVIIPSLYGTEARKEAATPRRTSSRWDKDKFFERAQSSLTPQELPALKKLFEWTSSNADDYTWGTGSARGSFSAKFRRIGGQSAFSALTDGSIWLNLDYIIRSSSPSVASELVAAIRSVGIPVTGETGHPTLKPEDWILQVDGLIHAFDQVLTTKEDQRNGRQ